MEEEGMQSRSQPTNHALSSSENESERADVQSGVM